MELSELPVDNTLNQEGATAAGITANEAAAVAEPTVTAEPSTDLSTEPEVQPEVSSVAIPATKEEIIASLSQLAEKPADEIGNEELARLKQQFYLLHNEEQRKLRETFIAEGGDESSFMPQPDPAEEQLKEYLNVIKEKKAALRAEQEAERQANYEKKLALVEELKVMGDDTDNVNRHFQRVRDIQNEFKAIGEVPPTHSADLWKDYQDAIEKFYDQWKVNKELRDYDFKKNLADKQLLIEEAARLADEPDIIVAFKKLQELHDKWRETGPVAKEVREEIWSQFKEHSSAINKRYQAFFEERKAREQENETAKTAICERIEALDLSTAKSYNDWDELTRQVIGMQEEWKKLGFASRKTNNALFSRFRAACDAFFARKAEHFHKIKEELNENLIKKTALCEQAEALKDSTDWRKTGDQLVALQKSWKEIGAVPKRHSDSIWHRFQKACDYFFEQKKQATSGQRREERENLQAKLAVITELNALNAEGDTTPRGEAIEKLKELRGRWQSIGHVPFRDKDKIQESYRSVVGELSRKLDIRESRARMTSFETTLNEYASDGGNRLNRERERLARILENRRQELHTYENNMGFLSSKSKSGDSLMREMERKMQRLRDDIAELEGKIQMIDQKM